MCNGMKVICKNNIVTQNDEIIILISLIGIFEALKNGSVTINEAEQFIFSPYMVRKLEQHNCNSKIVNIIERGCELEDFESLIPEKLLDFINELEREVFEILDNCQSFYQNYWLE